MPITLRTLMPSDLPALQAIQQQYFALHPGRQPAAAQLYLSPYFAAGQNVLCAVDASGQLLAYAPYFPQNALAWVDIQTLPGLANAAAIQDALLAGLLALAQRGGQTSLNFQYAPSETEMIVYTQNHGANCAYNIYNLQRDLTAPIPDLPPPPGFSFYTWRMASEPEQRVYLAARNACFPEAPTTLEEWQFFAASPLWTNGANMAAFTRTTGETASIAGYPALPDLARQTLAASVLTFCEPGSPLASTEYIFTQPAYRGLGLARALIARALHYLKGQGLQAAALEVKAANSAALALYTSLGYQLVGETQVWEMRSAQFQPPGG